MTGFEHPAQTERLNGLIPPLQDRTVLLVGCGSVGSFLAEILVRHGVGGIIMIDPDTVEAANLSRTVYLHSDIGSPKVAALTTHLQDINPDVHVRAIQEPLLHLSEGDQADLIDASNIVVGATDDPAAQAALNHRAYAYGVPAVFPALYRQAHAGEIVITVPGATACWTCATGAGVGTDQTREKDYGTGRLAAETALGADILTVTSVAAKHILGLLASPGSPAGNQTLTAVARHSMCILTTVSCWDWFPDAFAGIDGQYAPQSVWLTVTGDPDCPVCGDRRRPPQPRPDLSRLGPGVTPS